MCNKHPLTSQSLILLVLLLLLGPHPVAAQRSDGLDLPLTMANQCGHGDEIHFTFAATGDTFPHENIQAVGELLGYDVLFDAVRPFLQAADLAYTNFDGAMLAGAGYTGYPAFNYNPALATALRNAGIDLVSTANNHILDRGPEGLDATLAVLDANGLAHHGAVPSTATERPPYLPLTLTRDGVSITIGFIAATWGTNGIPDSFQQVNLLYQRNAYGEQGGVRQSVLDAVAQAARETDLVIVATHWGFEYEFYPHASQIEAAQSLAAAGADVILGAQPHTLQPVDLLVNGDRTTLVIYSLANFLASQGAFQSQSFAATSVIFYVGLARASDGTVRITGYRYLPTIHIEADTRPAPLRPGEDERVMNHVRTIMRDPTGIRQVPALPPEPGTRIEVCPEVRLAEVPRHPIPGDFAQHYQTLGGLAPRPLTDAIAVLGLPLGDITHEPGGDCATTVPVFYTERQRLEWHAQQPWPYRVVGTQLGTATFQRRYPGLPVERRTDLEARDAFADPRFRAFYLEYGGLNIFGYPISGSLNEDHPTTGVPTTVQYFERARFELATGVSPDAPLSDQVRAGLLGAELRALGGAAMLCPHLGQLPTPGAVSQPVAPASPLPDTAVVQPGSDGLVEILAQATAGSPGWFAFVVIAGLVIALIALIVMAINDWQNYRRRLSRQGYRHRRTAHERFAASTAPPDPAQPLAEDGLPTVETGTTRRVPVRPSSPKGSTPPAPPPHPRSDDDDDDLLKELLGRQ
ncbi:CapA family protein [Candidatus Chloroploca asiatica]|uniref:Capsule synthesis protein CapA domain-containing protein n=1 Tax=Candidatus Chloroploca asiatica TaxID=1506545 RepID=A0A2H3KL06_9CHLR|nr:CapA family protein [Candidatus Chloroploca asiatica]PDV98670.1 hypothetical protein A9Q02_01625 [Candidatus Chloroploca asiatica]